MRGNSDQINSPAVLIVEPDDTRVQAIKQAFSEHEIDWAIDTAPGTEAASDLIAKRMPSLVLASASIPVDEANSLVPRIDEAALFPLVIMYDAAACRDAPPSSTHPGVFDHLVLSENTPGDIPHRTSQILKYWQLLDIQSESVAQLRDKEEFNFALFQHNPSATVAVDKAGLVIKSNLARRAMDESLPGLGRPLFNAHADKAEHILAVALADCIEKGKLQTFEEVQLGDTWYEFTMAPLPNGAIVLSHNITKRKNAEAAAEEQQRQLIHADKMVALGTLVSGVAHEVSNPNNAMILSGTALRRMIDDVLAVLDQLKADTGDFDVGPRNYDEVREDLPQMVDVMNRSAERIKNIVGDLKTYARRGSETLSETVDINEVIDASVSLLSSLIKDSTVNFSVQKMDPLPKVLGNAQQIEQVLINLITNACQALENKQSHISVSSRFDAPASTVVLEVQDAGPGIDAEIIERITEPFFTTKHDDGGTGLGLSISRTIIENHGGEIRFASQPGKGTLATILLPQRDQEAEANLSTEGSDRS